MTGRFVPPYPPRLLRPVPTWRGFFGERAKTAVYGWSQQAFQTDYIRRRILGFTVHIILDPDMVQQVLLDNAANYAKPDIVRTLLDPIIGAGLLTSDGDLWREQRRIVAASFSPAAVKAQQAMFVDAARAAMARWHDGQRLDMAAEATRTTMTVIALALFGGDARLTSDHSMRQIAAAIAFGGAGGSARRIIFRRISENRKLLTGVELSHVFHICSLKQSRNHKRLAK